jgi:hypothetical protein
VIFVEDVDAFDDDFLLNQQLRDWLLNLWLF